LKDLGPRAARRLPDHSVWALLHLSEQSEHEVRTFFLDAVGLKKGSICSKMHITVYHARRRFPDLQPSENAVEIRVEPTYWRFMSIAPGGENRREDINTSLRPIGVRIQRTSPAYREIQAFRAQFYSHETPSVLRGREPSGERRSAFGAHFYQPHMKLLRAGSGIDSDLSRCGQLFRAQMPALVFDRFTVRCMSAADR
jgi:hypothetical protein